MSNSNMLAYWRFFIGFGLDGSIFIYFSVVFGGSGHRRKEGYDVAFMIPITYTFDGEGGFGFITTE